jgi:hypothetical protein
MRLANFIAIIAFAAPFKYACVKARMRWQVVETARKRVPFVSCTANQINTGASTFFRLLAGAPPRNPDPVQ